MVNPLTEISYMTNEGTSGTKNADVAIKKYHVNIHVNILFWKINLSILAKLKNQKNKI